MSVLDQIKALEEQKAKLLADAKEEAMAAAEEAVATLNELGFNYRLVEAGAAPVRTAQTGTRRTGIRQDVLRVVEEHQDGISRAEILELMEAKGDKKAEQSISNALANLKKAEQIVNEDGKYKVKGA